MRPNHVPTVHNSGTVTEDVKLSLDASATAHLISVLTNLYSDPMLAVIREYSTNALDAQIEAGVSAPIEVTLPTSSNLFFRVKDHGIGLSVDGLREVYALYGRSTKRDSDEVNGILGLGCKSALTYAPSYNVTAVKGGVKTLATIVKGDDGVGVIRIIDTVSTTEANGVEVSIPVRQYDVTSFRTKAAEFYRYWRPGTVLIDGKLPESIFDDEKAIWIDPDVALVRGMYGCIVVQHNVAYHVRRGRLGDLDGIVAFVPSGSVNFTPSREDLHYTARTNDTLSTLAEYVEDGLARTVERELEGKSNYDKLVVLQAWAKHAPTTARLFYRSIGGAHLKLGGRSSFLVEHTYKGHTASKAQSVAVSQLLGNNPIVTGFTANGVSPLAKARLEDLFDEATVRLIPDGVDVSVLQGRDNVHTWADVLAKTEHVKVANRGTGRGETTYMVWHANRPEELTVKEVIERTEGKGLPVLYIVDSYAGDLARRYPDAYLAVLKPVSEERFTRLLPGARSGWRYNEEQVAAAKAALTRADKLWAAAQSWSGSFLKDEASRIDDPEFGLLLALKGQPASDRIQRCELLGVQFRNETSSLVEELAAKYPLVPKCYSPYGVDQAVKDDLVLYINTKHAASA